LKLEFYAAETKSRVCQGKSPPIYEESPIIAVTGKCSTRRVNVFLLHEPQYDVDIERNITRTHVTIVGCEVPPSMISVLFLK
jgi:hypothetical protein